jgi:ribonuclease HI
VETTIGGINSDGSLKGSLGHGAGAAVLRNNEGAVVAAQARWYGPITDALEAEAMAAWDGLLLAKQLAFSDVVLETDCSVLVKALTDDSMDRSIIAGIWNECKELFRSFNNVRVCFTRREGNMLADRCVKEASTDSPLLLSLADFPLWLKEAAAIDCNYSLYE